MFGELLTGLLAEEAQMQITEGETVNYAIDIRTTELAITNRSNPGATTVTVVPQSRLAAAAKREEVISHPDLPVDLHIVRFDENSLLTGAPLAAESDAKEPKSVNLATTGIGERILAKPAKSVTGVAGGEVNRPSAYVELLNKETGQSEGVYLTSLAGTINEQPFQIAGKDYDLQLRFKRLYKPYEVRLIDFDFKRYPGTNVPYDYRSEVQLIDPSRSVDRQLAIYMNNPLRYGGDTLYQSGFDPQTEKATILQVVNNTGWMVPYVSCMLVAAGMLAHFGLTLGRFLRRRVEDANRVAKRDATAGRQARKINWRAPAVFVPTLLAIIWGGLSLEQSSPAKGRAGRDAARRVRRVATGRRRPHQALRHARPQHADAALGAARSGHPRR